MRNPDSEHAIMQAIMLELSKCGCFVWRANVGVFFTQDGRRVSTGLPPGFSDLYGHRPDGKAFYLEVKKPGGKPTDLQMNFLGAMACSGAISGWASSVEEAKNVILL